MVANDEPGTDDGREYRTEELAGAAGITVRTLRFYRERKLLPPPRRDGRIAWYGERHLARLRTIAALLERGHTLGGIAELFAAFESGRDVGELLGLESAIAVPWSEETQVRLSPEALADRFRGEATPENLAASMDLGYITGDGDTVVHVSRRLLDASSALVEQGVPLSVVLAAAREVRSHADQLAELFTRIISKHVLANVLERAEPGRGLGPDDVARIAETIEQLRPISKAVVDAELAMAMDRRVRAELEAWGRDRGLDRAGDRRPGSEDGPDAGG